MGQLGQHLVPARAALIPALTQAYADEWFAQYNYWFVVNTLSGPAAPAVASCMRQKARRALVHANRLAGRIAELGGQPVAKLTELVQHATDKPFKLPADVRDLDGVLKAVLDAERTSIRTYQRLYEHTRDTDPITQALALELLTEAGRGEAQLERLLGAPAPELSGQSSSPPASPA
jgi:ferritin-like protein